MNMVDLIRSSLPACIGEPTALSSERVAPEALADLHADASHTVTLQADSPLEASLGVQAAGRRLAFEVS
jgi:hypothetical protein